MTDDPLISTGGQIGFPLGIKAGRHTECGLRGKNAVGMHFKKLLELRQRFSVFAGLEQHRRALHCRAFAGACAGEIRRDLRVGISQLAGVRVRWGGDNRFRQRLACGQFLLILPPKIERDKKNGNDDDDSPKNQTIFVRLYPRPQFEKISRCRFLCLHNGCVVFPVLTP